MGNGMAGGLPGARQTPSPSGSAPARRARRCITVQGWSCLIRVKSCSKLRSFPLRSGTQGRAACLFNPEIGARTRPATDRSTAGRRAALSPARSLEGPAARRRDDGRALRRRPCYGIYAMTEGWDHSVSRPVATPRVPPLKAPVFLCEMNLARAFRRTPRRGVADLDLDGADRGLGQRGAFRAWRQAATSVGTRCFPTRPSCTSRSPWAAGISERLRSGRPVGLGSNGGSTDPGQSAAFSEMPFEQPKTPR
jgi:hypothetical protein